MDEAQGGPAGPGGRVARGGGIPAGRVLGVPIRLTVPWLLLAVLITVGYGGLVSRRLPDLAPVWPYLIGLGLVACLLGSILLHELGHALAARRHGVVALRVTLDLLGGHTDLERDLPRPGAAALVALVGPAVSAVCGLACLGAWAALPDGWLGDAVLQVALVNLVVAGYNALPGLPLDGGRALGAAVWALSGRRDLGDEVAGWGGRLVAVATWVLGAVGYATGRLAPAGVLICALVALSLWSGAGTAVRHARTLRRLPALLAGALARPVRPVPAGTPVAQLPPRQPGTELGVVDSAGRLIGLVEPVLARRVPTRLRPWTAVTEVASPVPVGDWLPAQLAGTALLARISQPDGRLDPSRVFPVALHQDGVGILIVADVLRALGGGPSGRRPAAPSAPARHVPPGSSEPPGSNGGSGPQPANSAPTDPDHSRKQ
jgi:Zn-dependent protease